MIHVRFSFLLFYRERRAHFLMSFLFGDIYHMVE